MRNAETPCSHDVILVIDVMASIQARLVRACSSWLLYRFSCSHCIILLLLPTAGGYHHRPVSIVTPILYRAAVGYRKVQGTWLLLQQSKHISRTSATDPLNRDSRLLSFTHSCRARRQLLPATLNLSAQCEITYLSKCFFRIMQSLLFLNLAFNFYLEKVIPSCIWVYRLVLPKWTFFQN